jgi:hypothetical protein
VSLSGLVSEGRGQLSLFEAADGGDRQVARAVDALKKRFGRGAVTRAELLDEE